MSPVIIHSLAQVGIEAPAVTVEIHIANGLPGLSIVGLPEAAIHPIAGHQHYLANWQMRPFRAPHHTASAGSLSERGLQPKT